MYLFWIKTNFKFKNKLWSNKNSGPKNLLCPANFGSKNLLCPNKFWVKKCLGSKTFLVKIQMGPIFFWSKLNWFPTITCDVVKLNFRVKKSLDKNICGSQKCCVQNLFVSNLFVWSKCRVKFCETKKFWSTFFFGEQSYPKKYCISIFWGETSFVGQTNVWSKTFVIPKKMLVSKKNCETIFLA